MSGRGKGGKGLGKGGALVNFRAQAMEIIENLDEESDYGQLLSMEGDGGVADVVICYLEFEKNGDNKKFDEEMEMAHEIYGDDVFFPAVKYFDEHFDIDSKKVRNESDSGSEPKVVEEVVDSDSDSDSDSEDEEPEPLGPKMCCAKTGKGDPCKTKAKGGEFCGRHKNYVAKVVKVTPKKAAKAPKKEKEPQGDWEEWVEEGSDFEEEEGFEYEYCD